MILPARSLQQLDNVHTDLVKVVRQAAANAELEFIVTEGRRSLEKQRLLFAKGATQTMKSRHLTGHAVDLAALVDGEVRWDWPLYAKLAEQMKAAAKVVGVPVEWGGDWITFKDGPHFQLPWSAYP